MITTGIIREVAVDKGNFVGNAYRVELNIFQIPGDNDKKNYTYIANCSVAGGLSDSYNVGDVVYVGFLNNNKSLPVILGKIYQGLKDEPRSIANLNALKVNSKAELPKNTTIGGIDFSDKAYFFENANEVIQDKNLFVDSVQFKTGNEGAGLAKFDDKEGVLGISLSPYVTMALGVDAVLKVYNDTASTLVDGQAVYVTNNDTEITPVALALASNYGQAERVVGVMTEAVAPGSTGFVTRRGFVGGLIIDPTEFSVNDALYLSSTVPGAFTSERPLPPNFITKIGFVTKVSSGSGIPDGQIYAEITNIPIAADILYDNEVISEADKRLDSKNVQGAVDELQLRKADISMLSSNITLYRTRVLTDPAIINPLAPGDIYKTLVTSIDDSRYDTVAVPVSSGIINVVYPDEQYISGSVSAPGLFVGNPGQITIFSIGKLRKAATNTNPNKNAEFFFKVYRRDVDGVEHLVATSASTGVVSSYGWSVFNAAALLNNGSFVATDRIVVKSYARAVGVIGGEFEYEFGGTGGDANPFRVLIPVPVSVIPTSSASAVITDTSQFNGMLSHLDINVQKALETIDDDAFSKSKNVHNDLSGRNTADSHPATAISVVPLNNVQATSVQAALYELDNEKLQKSSYPGAWTESEGALNYYGPFGWSTLAKGTTGQALVMGSQYPAWGNSLRDLVVNNSGISIVPLTINSVASQTGNLQSWKVAGAEKAYVDKDGVVSSVTGFKTNDWTIDGQTNLQIKQGTTPVITVYTEETDTENTTGTYPIKVNIDAVTTITELEFGGW